MPCTHTPGPWSTNGRDVTVGDPPHTRGVPGWRYVASCVGGDAEETAANARLIAAAPDLLAALREMLRVYPYTECGATLQARAALAKAGGDGGPSARESVVRAEEAIPAAKLSAAAEVAARKSTAQAANNYVRVSDDDGEIHVEDQDKAIAVYRYSSRASQVTARLLAEKRAAREAKARGCEWDCNY